MQTQIVQMLTNAQVAAVLAVKEKTLNQWRWRGGGPRYVKVGRLVRYAEVEIQKWLESQSRNHTANQPPD